jgi:hypothetical protein
MNTTMTTTETSSASTRPGTQATDSLCDAGGEGWAQAGTVRGAVRAADVQAFEEQHANALAQQQAAASERWRDDTVPAWAATPPWLPLQLGHAVSAPAAPTSAGAEVPAAWAEVAMSLQQLLVQATQPGAVPMAQFTLSPDLLAQTSLQISRTASGWRLKLDSLDARLNDDAEFHEARLCTRFAHSGLGELVIERSVLPVMAG